MKASLLIVFSMLLFACNQDDEPAILDVGLEGEWVLSKVSCFCAFEPDIDFSQTQINFNTERDLVTVVHNGDYTFFREAGDHFYGGQVDRIGFGDNTVYRFEIEGSLLTLIYQDNPQIADDEVTYVFKR